MARRLTSDTASAQDLVQQTLLLAWRSFHQFRAGSNERAWLFRILVNEFRTNLRKGRIVTARLESESDGPGRAPDFDGALEMAQALDALSLEHRTVLLLGVVEGFTCQEISEVLAAPIGTVMSRLSRAREALRTQLTVRAPHYMRAKGEES